MLTATVSHDMKTPLNAIIGISQSLHNFIQGEAPTKLLKIVNNSSKILMFLVNDLLDFFQLKHGKFNLNPQLSSIQKCVEELVEMFAIPAEEKGLKLEAQFAGRVP